MNRKQRRAQPNDHDLPLTKPSDDPRRRQPKTLYEIAAERQAALTSSTSTTTSTSTTSNSSSNSKNKTSNLDFSDSTKFINVTIGPDGKVAPLNDGEVLPVPLSNLDADGDGETTLALDEYSPILDTLLFSISLSALHFTLEALTVHQYAEKLVWRHVFWHTVLQAFPVLTVLVYFVHGHVALVGQEGISARTRRGVRWAREAGFVGVAVLAGCRLVKVTNEKGYMAVMKGAPGVGTVWVWCVMESGLGGAVLGVLGPGVYAWWYGYGIW